MHHTSTRMDSRSSTDLESRHSSSQLGSRPYDPLSRPPLVRRADLDPESNFSQHDYSGYPYGPTSNTKFSFDTNNKAHRPVVIYHEGALHSVCPEDPSMGVLHIPASYEARDCQPLLDYEIEGGWSYDEWGRTYYKEHGKIEEVDEEHTSRPPSPSDQEVQTFGTTEPLPGCTTPPPRPMRLSMTLPPTGCFPPECAEENPPLALPSSFSTSALDDSEESSVLEENLASIEHATTEIGMMRSTFAPLYALFNLQCHVDTCSRIQHLLSLVRDALNRRFQIGNEQWRLRSSSWHQKYGNRLLSLRTTLQKLRALKELLPPRIEDFRAILNKLREHEEKLSDLAFKFNASFDRLRERHLHALLSEAHAEARKTRTAQISAPDSFDQNEQKAIRDGLRREYQWYRSLRRPSMTA